RGLRVEPARSRVGAAPHPALVQGPRVQARGGRYPMTAERATRADRAVVRAAHPVAFPLVSAIPGGVRRVPGVVVVVKDAGLLRAVLMDSEHFTKNGPGAPSDLWTPVLDRKSTRLNSSH